jgi:hypothetical protein
MDKDDLKRARDYLRYRIERLQSRFADIEEGYYLAFDDGDFEGGWNDAGEAHKQAERAAAQGASCTIVRVGKRFTARDEEEW